MSAEMFVSCKYLVLVYNVERFPELESGEWKVVWSGDNKKKARQEYIKVRFNPFNSETRLVQVLESELLYVD